MPRVDSVEQNEYLEGNNSPNVEKVDKYEGKRK